MIKNRELKVLLGAFIDVAVLPVAGLLIGQIVFNQLVKYWKKGL